ncbi:MAG: 1-acyl-sn-glycerol-3-phosphate acyltransferase [Chloroflexota bacterium]|jgi:1-acyl-sn-glycerol-3-phosphate acyltransferase|nr:1-acyl-sn-glycerol-3-phosphate acyltransferase [Chloroflexota bacterium]
MLYDFLQVLVRVVLGIFFRVEVLGRENVPDEGCLVVSNHLSWTDTVFIMYALPRKPRLHTMANESTVFNTGFKRWLMPKLAVFPIRRNRGMLDEQAVNQVYDLLNGGERVLIFPEGAYGKDGQLMPLKDGVGHFAINSGKPLLPVLLTGTGRLRPFSRVTVDIGKPFVPESPLIWGVKERVQAAVDAVRDAFGRLGRRAGTAPRRWPWQRSARGVVQAVAVKGDDAQVEGKQPDRD